jgi:hypothetical protein
MRTVVLLLVLSLTLGGLVGSAAADTFLGDFCWQKVPFPDIVKLGLSQGNSIITANGVQFSSSYSLPFTGSLFIIGNVAILGGVFAGDLIATHFGGSSALSETVTISLANGNGPGTIIGIDGKFAASQSTWTFVPCPAGPTVHLSGSSERAQGNQGD